MVGETIGSYRITGKLGEGGMGVVYLGEHQRIARKAAIKVLLSNFSKNQDVVDRFFREAMATSRIRHPGIVEVTDCDLLPNGCAYIIMELLEGESLGAHLRRHGRLSVQRAVFLARHIADALAAAHDEKIVHRDLKPDNIFVPSASAQPIKVVDFGIAKLLDTESGKDHRKTRTGSIIGTPVYMSPEQCRGRGEIDHRTDIYSLGCIVFEMLAGRPPFTDEGFGELIHSHLGVVPPTLRSLDPAIPESIDALVARMLAKAPDERPHTMRALVEALDAIGTSEPSVTRARVTRSPAMTPPAGGTMLLPPTPGQMPKVQTTLRSASAEKMDVVSTQEVMAVAKRRRVGAIVGVAIAVVAAGGMGIWRASGSAPTTRTAFTSTPTPMPTSTSASAPSAPVLAEAPPVAPRAAAPTLPLPEPPLVASLPPAATTKRHPPADLPGSGPPTHLTSPPAMADRVRRSPAKPETVGKRSSPHKVHVTISTTPSGADVCLASDRVLLGKTAYDWTGENSANTIKFLLRKTGYRGQELSVSADGDTKHRIALERLGRDDIDDVVNCKPR